MKGIIFDFNGTLYWDSQLHYDAWREYSKMLRGYEFTDEEMRDKMFGHTNEDIIEYAIGKKPSKEMVDKYTELEDSTIPSTTEEINGLKNEIVSINKEFEENMRF